MIYGIGIDSVLIKRIEKSMKSDHFLKRVYGKEEIAFFNSKKKPAKSAAANFAAKEAFSKALKTGIFSGKFELKDVQILRTDNGAPYYYLTNEALKIIEDSKLKAHVSLTHEGDYASAFTIIEALD